MKYHLEKFDTLINNESRECIEVGEIIDELKHTAFRLRNDAELSLFIQNHQTMLLKFKVHTPISEQADKMLFFIETHFSKFINPDLPISEEGFRQFWQNYAHTISTIREEIKSSISQKLYKLILPLTEPEHSQQHTIYNIKYLSSFWGNWPKNDSFKILNEEKLISYLICQNYNPPAFFKFLAAAILAELQQEEDPISAKQIFTSYSHRLNTILAKKGNAFDPQYPEVKPLLERWLKEEIKHNHKKLKKHNPNQLTILTKYEPKLETSLSVAQIALLFRALSQTGVITNKVLMEILKVLSEKFSSKKASTISIESLHTKYYNVDDRTKETTIDILKKLVKEVEMTT